MLKTLSALVTKSSGFAGKPASGSDTLARGGRLRAASSRHLRYDTLLLCTWVAAILAGWFAVAAIPAYGQIDRGTIEGLVTDQTGAIIPGAKVLVTNVNTNTSIALEVNDQGLYTASNLPSGTYRVVVSKGGFKTTSSAAAELGSSITLRVDVKLQPGQVTETVTVTGEAPILDVGTTNNSTGMQDNLIEQMPVIVAGTQRALGDYLQELPGYVGGSGFTPAASGSSAGDTETYIDGGPASEWGIARGGIEEVSPSIDQVGEMSVVSNAFNAEYGGFGNWFMNVVLKSGTNELHGTVYDHLGNSALNAKSYFATSITPYRQNEGGFTLGGPVVLPMIYNGRNKTFFFASLGLFYSRVGASGTPMTIPTVKECSGDFTELGVNIYDPLTRQQFVYNGRLNVIPQGRISPAAQTICSHIPAPDPDLVALYGGVSNNYHSRSAPTWPYFNTYTPLIKLDHSFSDKEKLSISYTNQIRHRIIVGSGYSASPAWGAKGTNPLDDYYDQLANSWKVRINVDSVITPALLNHFTLSADRYLNLGPNGTDGQGWDGKLGITGMPADNGAFPAITFSGGNQSPTGFQRAYEENWHEMRYTLDENLSWTHGKHAFKFGAEIGSNREIRFIKPGVAGSFQFNSLSTSDSASDSANGSSFASFMLGAVNTASAYIPLEADYRYNHTGIFAQDDWHMTPKLTVSYGIRWDYMPPYSESHNYQTAFVSDITNPGAGNLPGALAFAGSGTGKYGKPFQDTFHGGWAPRLGLAYQINQKTMVRASSGIYYANSGNVVPFLDTGASGYSATPSFQSGDGGFTPLYYWNQVAGTTYPTGTTFTFPQNFQKPPAINPSFLNGQNINYIPRNGDRLPQTVNWVLDIEREVAHNLALDVMYIGSHSTHLGLSGSASLRNYVPKSDLSMSFGLLAPCTSTACAQYPYAGFASQLGSSATVAQALRPYPQYLLVNTDAVLLPEGKSHYDSMQIKLTKRMSYGLSGLAFFTWSKNLTNDAGGVGSTTYASSFGSILQYPGQNPVTIDPQNPAAILGASFSYELPFGKGRMLMKTAPAAVDAVLGGWTVSGSFRYTSGAALQIEAFNFFASNLGYNVFGAPIEYANYVGGNPKATWSGKFNPYKNVYLNSTAFSSPASFALGNTQEYNSWIRGFSQGSEALEVGKTISIHERFKFDLGADFVNPFNIVRWSDPSNLLGGGTFGVVSGTQGTPREIQMNAKIRF
ncbi:MAG: TonB-dependent receptor [Terracidiphilus sp.]|jgi:hypothetical protein